MNIVVHEQGFQLPVPSWLLENANTVKCRYNAVFGVQEIDRVIAVTAL